MTIAFSYHAHYHQTYVHVVILLHMLATRSARPSFAFTWNLDNIYANTVSIQPRPFLQEYAYTSCVKHSLVLLFS